MKRLLRKAVLLLGVLSWGAHPLVAQGLTFVRGDVNQDGSMDIADAVSVLLYLFAPAHGVPCEKAADINDSGLVDLSDAIFGLQFLFLKGPPPPEPLGKCGADPTPDGLTCIETPCTEEGFPRVAISERCSAATLAELGWSVTNLEAVSVLLDWEIEGSSQGGFLTIAALDTVELTTQRVPGVNRLALYYKGRLAAKLEQATLIISEIMASSGTSIADEDGDSSDWIEIHLVDGPCASTTDLAGWYLTDDRGSLTQWRFPSVTIEKGGSLVVFASGKDRAVAGSELHTSFKLATEGEYLALVARDGRTIVDEFAPAYPEQLMDVSYGLTQRTTVLVDAGSAVLYHVPTAADAALGDGWADPGYVPSG